MSELPLWTEELGRTLLAANPWAAAVGPERTGCVFAWLKIPKEESDCWGNGKRECLGFFRLPPGREWHTLLVTRGPEKPPEPEPKLPEWAEPLVRQSQSLDGCSAKYDSPLWATLLPSQGLNLAALLIEECERLRGEVERLRTKQQELFDWVNDLAARCNGLAHSHKRLVEIADAARAQLADLPRNADGDVVLPPCDMWVVHRPDGAKPWVSRLRVHAIERWGTPLQWTARGYGHVNGGLNRLSDLYSTEESARRAAEVKP